MRLTTEAFITALPLISLFLAGVLEHPAFFFLFLIVASGMIVLHKHEDMAERLEQWLDSKGWGL